MNDAVAEPQVDSQGRIAIEYYTHQLEQTTRARQVLSMEVKNRVELEARVAELEKLIVQMVLEKHS